MDRSQIKEKSLIYFYFYLYMWQTFQMMRSYNSSFQTEDELRGYSKSYKTA